MDLDKREMIICVLSVSAALSQLLLAGDPRGWQRDGGPMGAFQGAREAQTIFITILRHCLPFSRS